MVRVLDVKMLAELIHAHGIENTLSDMMKQLEKDFTNWENFQNIPRPAFHVPDGVLELMPTCDDTRFSFKCVNGHPKNPETGKQTVVATGQLNRVSDGYPVLMTEMTLITAMRTAAVSALASDKLSRKDAETVAIIGTGAQSEYQLMAHKLIRNLTEVRYFDTDPTAMTKFAKNMGTNLAGTVLKMTPCDDVQDAVNGADIIIVCTACKGRVEVVKNAWVVDGQHINGLGGDCPGKTELEASILKRARVVVEYFDQSFIEGEIQAFDEDEAHEVVDAHMYEIVRGEKPARENDKQVTVFDGVGIGLEDCSALTVVYELAQKYNIGDEIEMVPDIADPKNLFGVLLDTSK